MRQGRGPEEARERNLFTPHGRARSRVPSASTDASITLRRRALLNAIAARSRREPGARRPRIVTAMKRAKPGKRVNGRTLVAAIRARLREELQDPRGELRLETKLERGGPCPELVAIAENPVRGPEGFVAVFKSDRAALEQALAEGRDLLADGDLVYLDRGQASGVRAAIDRVFGGDLAQPPRRRSAAASSVRRETRRRS